jgi:dihydroorotate dehydrogenase
MDPYRLVRPLLAALDPETAHHLTLWTLKSGLVPAPSDRDDPILAIRVLGRQFANPLGLAAGFDKNAEVVEAMLRLGFGFVEVGTVTPRPQAGNPRPRLFRLTEDRAVINRLGFNNQGLERVAARLAARVAARPGGSGVVGANIGRNADSADAAADYERGLRALHGRADYLVVNVSSPNTPGLRALQARAPLGRLLGRLLAARGEVTPAGTAPLPLLVKISPDLDRAGREAVAEVALERGIDGLVVSNTTTAARAGLKSRHRHQDGGLSGAPLFAPATELLAEMYRLGGGRLTLIGAGGVSSGADAYAKVRAGAALVQLYTALSEAVGADHA